MLIDADYLILQEALLTAKRLAKDVGTDDDMQAIDKAIGYIENQPLYSGMNYIKREKYGIDHNGMSKSFNDEMAKYGCD